MLGSERRDGCEAPADTPLDSECAGENMECESAPEEDGARAMSPCFDHGEKPCPGATLAPREYTTTGVCSVQSCLNQFTAQELLTVNNKVGCEACTERKHGKCVLFFKFLDNFFFYRQGWEDYLYGRVEAITNPEPSGYTYFTFETVPSLEICESKEFGGSYF